MSLLPMDVLLKPLMMLAACRVSKGRVLDQMKATALVGTRQISVNQRIANRTPNLEHTEGLAKQATAHHWGCCVSLSWAIGMPHPRP
ncbi:hypothetical protein PTSG_05738 [Salpingoeca rosetta]|uniref:Uncharacterized protein n=1 Tax=Salpingoeca rosetta (strain ATCC 50818 / BSB-021) TaxID=946362 RepID=F2UB32_SALR5|nr:uncharacterized protein PTSG_05738 [Salpingoeca rosetta]EGD74045.1 hypothetical protein PTSG_05738 [Salpingoeca rosetta]|eukprot:XP_004993607.1 hypothetical protein PTSG_05738 [Salpingoeca rosetta]